MESSKRLGDTISVNVRTTNLAVLCDDIFLSRDSPKCSSLLDGRSSRAWLAVASHPRAEYISISTAGNQPQNLFVLYYPLSQLLLSPPIVSPQHGSTNPRASRLALAGNINDIDPADSMTNLGRLAEPTVTRSLAVSVISADTSIKTGPIFKLNLGGSEKLFIASHELMNEVCDERLDLVPVPASYWRLFLKLKL